jgi:GT2 family glycosyltransferase
MPARAFRIWRASGWNGLRARARAIIAPAPAGREYATWIRRYDTPTADTRAQMRADVLEWPVRPLISVLMPVHEGEAEWLDRAIGSVRRQVYSDWELCIADDASRKPHVRKTLQRHAREDARIRLSFRASNGHISECSNTALALARGDFIALLDADDELHECALFWVAREIVEHPDADLIYSDEDKLDAVGERFDAYFKPDWNPALIRSQNMFCHLGVYRRSLVAKVGGFRVGFEGSQDHDLVLRCSEQTTPGQIRHIPRVLYHWRAHSGSTASGDAEAKPYAWRAGARAIEEHLDRCGTPGCVKPAATRFYQVEYRCGQAAPKVGIVIASALREGLLLRCLDTLLSRSTYPYFEILLAISAGTFADHASALQPYGDKRVRLLVYDDQSFNYSRINNWAIRQCDAPLVCLLNDDTEIVTPGWLEQLVARVHLTNVGAVGAMLHYPDGTIQHAGVVLGMGGVAAHPYGRQPGGSLGYFGRASLEQDLSCVTAACMLLRRKAFDDLGGFDERLAIAFNDVDLCLRLRRAGWRIVFTPAVVLLHHESVSVGRPESPARVAQFAREVAFMREHWADVLDADPFYNPNLSLERPFELAFPPRLPPYVPRSAASKRSSEKPADDRS